MKKIIIALIAVAALAVALFSGVAVGNGGLFDENSNENDQNNSRPSTTDSSTQENLNTGDLVELVAAFDSFASSDVQKNEIEIELESKAFSVDQDFEIVRGSYNGKIVTKIGKGAISGYVCDGKVYNEIGDSMDIQGIDEEKIADIDIKQVLDVVYKICSEGDFSVTEDDEEKTYRLSLTGSQIADIIGYMGSEIEGYNIDITAGIMSVSLENGALSEIEIGCSGNVKVLNMDIPLTLTITDDTQGMNNATMALPQAVIDKIG